MSDFVRRSRFNASYQTKMTPAEFVDELVANAGVTPSDSDRSIAINEFSSATNASDASARGRALRDVAENSILTQQEFNRAFVLMHASDTCVATPTRDRILTLRVTSFGFQS